MHYEMDDMRSAFDPRDATDRAKGSVSDAAWRAYLRNCGIWSGRRALCNARGKVLLDIPVHVFAERFKTPDNEDCVLWKTAIETASGIDEVEEEWSRDELGEFGALTEDGSFSAGNESFVGERFTVDQCIFEENDGVRVRSTFAYDWEGRLTGIVASRERKLSDSAMKESRPMISSAESSPSAMETVRSSSTLAESESEKVPEGTAPQLTSFVEPAAWRSPTILLDYSVGVWSGRGVVLDSRTHITRTIASRLELVLESDGVLVQRSQ
eukprot:IDg4555t1